MVRAKTTYRTFKRILLLLTVENNTKIREAFLSLASHTLLQFLKYNLICLPNSVIFGETDFLVTKPSANTLPKVTANNGPPYRSCRNYAFFSNKT